ncbi:hypothetical protein RND71_039864 [Anisodus tanguticus]|uniref:Uncharacterized protein n=1 Tax=Anisodus tanguticus TaxID=243964 RepID=A0AAE1UR14_9SOLA|nr:hypothetical protein RND71_039864 [Anisodus tanguticus]
MRLNGLLDPRTPPRPGLDVMFLEGARKILRLSQLEMLKSRLRKIEKSWILCSEFNEICSNDDQGMAFDKKVDESGDVIVLGNVFFLLPDQIIADLPEFISICTNPVMPIYEIVVRVQQWTRNFKPDIQSMLDPIQVTLLELPRHYHHLLEPIGPLIALDKAILARTKPITSKARVEIDLTRP